MKLTTRGSLILVAVLVLGPADSASPSSQYDSQHVNEWRRVESEHFVLVGNARESSLRRVGEQLEEFRAAVLAVMPEYEDPYETDTTVVVFDGDDSFRPFRPASDVAGYFTSGPHHSYIALTDEREMERTIYHEYVHQLTREARNWPTWLREGAAEFYSTIEVRDQGETVRIGLAIRPHLLWLSQRFMPLEEFLDPKTSFDDAVRTRTLYAQGWAFLHYMQFGQPQMGQWLNDFTRRLGTGMDVASSVRMTFGIDLESLERDFVRYVRSPASLQAGDLELTMPLGALEMPDPAPITETEASTYLGDLLLHLGRYDEAESYLELALALGGEFEPALTTLHILHDRRGNDRLANEFLERAVRVPDAGYLPHLLTARQLLGEQRFQDVAVEAEAHLRRVVEQRPDLSEGYFWLGQLLMRQPARIGEAVGALATADRLGRGNPDIRLTHAQAVWMSGNGPAALALLAELTLATGDNALLERARELRAEITGLR